MKYIIIPFIAFGLTLSLIFGVEYNCQGKEMFPIYYGSPFIFIQKSLGSSMEYYYSISGLLLNILTWSLILVVIRFGINKLIGEVSNKRFLIAVYKICVAILILFSLLNIWISYIGIGRGFKEGLNYWYWNFDKEASDWGMECNGDWKFFIFKN